MCEIQKPNYLILCDYSWMFRQYLHVFDKLSIINPATNQEVKTGVVYGFTKFIESVCFNYKKKGITCKIIFCFDSKSDERTGVFEDYKSNRPKNVVSGDVFSSNKTMTYQVCSLAKQVAFASLENKEADDIIAMLAIKNLPRFDKVIIYSGDKDFLQLTSIDKIFVANKRDKGDFVFYTDDSIKESFDGCDKKYLLPYRAIRGDKSDGIPSVVPRVPSKLVLQFAKLIHENSNILPVLTKEAFPDFTDKEFIWYEKLLENISLLNRNISLMSLLKYTDPNLNKSVNVFKSFTDVTYLLELLQLNNFKLFLTKLQ